MSLSTTDTIFAPATPTGGAVAIIRISGKSTKDLLSAVFAPMGSSPMRHGELRYGQIINANREVLDEAMAVYFAAPHSYTGQDSAELHTHGGAATVASVLELLCSYARPARGGEFTERAFLSGKLNLAEAEAVMDLINATAKRSANSALVQLRGELSTQINAATEQVLSALALLSAAIDFPDEMEDEAQQDVPAYLNTALGMVSELIDIGMKCRVLREGAKIVLLGKPNAGKSSLLNAISGQNRAIVTDEEGTTRDTVEIAFQLSGCPCILTDTAGLRDGQTAAERLGIERTYLAADEADILLFVVDGSIAPSAEDIANLSPYITDARTIFVFNKSDLGFDSAWNTFINGKSHYFTSSLSHSGVSELKQAIEKIIVPGIETPLVTNARHIAALVDAKNALTAALNADDADCIVTDANTALTALGSITGNSVSTDVVDEIFKRFCVGK